ncbi:MAG: hypothetical protein FJ318_10605 [SAR202 cluster bacterium]|nr:hypothetical protein [SAR202 cluster bacterium]
MNEPTNFYLATFTKSNRPCFVAKDPRKPGRFVAVWFRTSEAFIDPVPCVEYGTEREFTKILRCERVNGRPVRADQPGLIFALHEAESEARWYTREFKWRMRHQKRIGSEGLCDVAKRLAFRNRAVDRLAERKPGWLADLWRKSPEATRITFSLFAAFEPGRSDVKRRTIARAAEEMRAA